jgi:hypothetical protein
MGSRIAMLVNSVRRLGSLGIGPFDIRDFSRQLIFMLE